MNKLSKFVVVAALTLSSTVVSAQQYINEMDTQDFEAIGINHPDAQRITGYRNILEGYSNYDQMNESGISEATYDQIEADANIQLGGRVIHLDEPVPYNPGGWNEVQPEDLW